MRKLLHSMLIILVFLGVLSGCAEDDRPETVLTEEQMVPILKDMQIAYAGVDNTVRNPAHRADMYEEMNQLILLKHDMDKELFFDSYSWYEAHPVLLDTIFQRIITQLNIDIVPLQNKQQKRPKAGVPEAK